MLPTLSKILDASPDELNNHTDDNDPAEVDEPPVVHEINPNFCIECEDQPADVKCLTCQDVFCQVCFQAQHRKGTRKLHITTPFTQPTPATNGASTVEKQPSSTQMDISDDEEEDQELDNAIPAPAPTPAHPSSDAPAGEWYVERSKYIPLRLSLPERKYLRLLEAALTVSEYTDKIDTLGFSLTKNKRIVHQIKELCSILSGLVVAADYKLGQELFADREFDANQVFFQTVFEFGRRHKIMNPDKMRTTYGKLMFVLMDSQIPEVKQMLNFDCVVPIKTVYSILEQAGALDMLRDKLISVATREIIAEGRSRRDIQKEIKAKEKAIETLSSYYTKPGVKQEDLRQCLYSIGDNHAFLRTNRDPCEKMIGYLKQYFHPTKATDNRSLSIHSGKGGARLSHSHAQQYAYVLQSLTLWREILHEMFQLWTLAEQDLLSDKTTYRLRDTGQGLNRVQPAPKTSRMMHAILNRAQQSIGNWVGSSVIHMGDHNVPNALMFIDKYSQIYRILLPITNTLSQIPNLADTPSLKSYITSEYGSVENVYLTILTDFFRHAFDGSGADNFYDAGSCIDGRLTSAWNWCSSLEKKKFYHIFLLTGFVSFDGEW